MNRSLLLANTSQTTAQLTHTSRSHPQSHLPPHLLASMLNNCASVIDQKLS